MKTENQLKAELALMRLHKLQSDVEYLGGILRNMSENVATFEEEGEKFRTVESAMACIDRIKYDASHVSLAIRA